MSDVLETLLATAARAPSVHNTQPWRFRATGKVVELYADPSRQLDHTDPTGREMLISCGAALFGLQLAVRQLGFHPVVQLLPTPSRPELVARVRIGGPAPSAWSEQRLFAAVRRRHTHRGPFAPEPLPLGLLAVLQRDAEAEAASLAIIQDQRRYGLLADLTLAAERNQQRDAAVRRELLTWTRPLSSAERDGVPAPAYAREPDRRPGALAPRDFDLGRGWGSLANGPARSATATVREPRPATAVLLTDADTPADWLHAGQALHRLLLRGASHWVFASLHTQPLELEPVRAAIRSTLRLPGVPQMVLQLGRYHITRLTPRRPVTEVVVV
jgi:hypothetical protein